MIFVPALLALSLSAAPSLPVDAPVETFLGAVPTSAHLLPPGTFLAAAEESSPSFFVGLLEFTFGTVGGYVALVGGVVANATRANLPLSTRDVFYFAGIPALGAAIPAFLIGLVDLSSRQPVWSLLHALFGAALGEAVGLVLGLYVIAPLVSSTEGDRTLQALVAIASAPVVSAFGAALSMELLKSSGNSVARPSVAAVMNKDGSVSLAPAVAFTF